MKENQQQQQKICRSFKNVTSEMYMEPCERKMKLPIDPSVFQEEGTMNST
jgi:hypothetical protein